ncbi:cilia- and flagella-associated protein 263 isoform X3 [Pteropus medius]|uniref:coiled-coil domain-containing protein 113 isoform X3 n=1 Tax=Pteropus vampyrus TaxID=132908 RepID=UPI00196A6CAB|nr:coiled-coil domain-containing protein 113 isoform X3 [Pteropus giganteus]
MMSEDDSGTSTTELHVEEDNELPIIQLCGLVEEFSYGNSALKTETEMFEKYYNKLEPRDQKLRISEIKISGPDFTQLRSRRRSKSRIGVDRVTSLSVDQKCELVQKELEDTKEELRHLRANAERDLQYHEAIIEEAEIRWTEIRRAVHEFKKDILKTISKKKGSILATQRVMKYIEDMNRRRDNMKDKLRLKNVSLKVQRKKMLLQLRQTRLHRAMEVSVTLEKEISLRNELLEKLERETLQVEEDRAKAEALNKQLRKQLSEFRAPPVMLYVKQKAINGDLEKTIKMWERKVEIAEVSRRKAQDGQAPMPFTILFRILVFELRIQIFGHVTSVQNLSSCSNSLPK